MFTIAEMGFGAGINFLLAQDCWKRHSRPGDQLHYMAWEAHPLDCREMRAAHDLFHETAPAANILTGEHMPPIWPGWHRVELEHGVRLTLAYEDVAGLAQARLAADAWFLDGFAPEKNPRMWSAQVLAEVFRLTAPGGTVATYTSAGIVRRRLDQAGFEVHRQDGFGPKRHMTVANKPGTRERPKARPVRVGVVGAGIAGACVANALCRRGIDVTVFDEIPHGHSGTGGIPQALISARLPSRPSVLSTLAVASLSHAYRFARKLGVVAEESGALLVAHSEKEKKRQAAVAVCGRPASLVRAVDQAEASRIAGIPLTFGGLWVKEAVRVDGRDLVRTLLAGTDFVCGSVGGLAAGTNGAGRVDLVRGDHHECDAVVVCASHGSGGLLGHPMRLGRKDGVMLLVPASGTGRDLKVTLLFGGMLTPAGKDGCHMLTSAQHAGRLSVDWLDASEGEICWEGTRCTTSDRLPVAGQVADGLYVLTGLGYRGFTYAPQLAEYVTSLVLGEPSNLPQELERAVSPVRSSLF